MNKIGFQNLKIHCIIGDLPEERVTEQIIYVDLTVVADITKTVTHDDIAYGVDYVALSELCKQMAIEGKYHLIETYISAVLESILERFPVDQATMRVRKPGGIADADCAFVELTKGRQVFFEPQRAQRIPRRGILR